MNEHVCKYMPTLPVRWERVPRLELVDTASGRIPRRTAVQICRSERYVHVRFECEDDFVKATFTERDDPIFREDVVEIFIDENRTGTDYMEFELSPRNVVFDARILWGNDGKKVHKEWDAEGLDTHVDPQPPGRYRYDWRIPVDVFNEPPAPGDVWHVNFYRIDENRDGARQYFAWSPTGKNDFHVPDKFGSLVFE